MQKLTLALAVALITAAILFAFVPAVSAQEPPPNHSYMDTQYDLLTTLTGVHDALQEAGVDEAVIADIEDRWFFVILYERPSIGFLLASYDGMINALGSFEAGWLAPWEFTDALLAAEPVSLWDVVALGDWRYDQSVYYEDTPASEYWLHYVTVYP